MTSPDLVAVADRDAAVITATLRADHIADLFFHQRVQHAESDADEGRRSLQPA